MPVDVLQEMPWEQVTEGVILYRLTADASLARGEYVPERSRSAQQRLILFFCFKGGLTLRRKLCADLKICRGEILLLSDFSDLASITVEEAPTGYCLVIDPAGCRVFSDIYKILGCSIWSYGELLRFLQKHEGYFQIKHSLWKQSLLSVLESLPEGEQGSYCVLKAAELCYLIHTSHSVYDDITQPSAMPDYLTELLISLGIYIENHLDEKLTISQLCRQFNLSPTTLKNKFREFYGQPIHNWIQCHRIRRAAELLQSTNMTVLQIAQSIGYESVSQFNVIFRRTYGTTPSLYKKRLMPKEIS